MKFPIFDYIIEELNSDKVVTLDENNPDHLEVKKYIDDLKESLSKNVNSEHKDFVLGYMIGVMSKFIEEYEQKKIENSPNIQEYKVKFFCRQMVRAYKAIKMLP